jgi:hypothetical protein
MSDSKMPEDLKTKVENLSGFQRKYCEFRSKGFTQALSAFKAGSTAEESARGRVGYQVEQIPGVKEYILYLQEERAKVTGVDELEVIQKIRQVFDRAMHLDKLKEANTSAQLLGEIIGVLGKGGSAKKADQNAATPAEAFKAEEDDKEAEERIKRLQTMMKDLQVVGSNKKGNE